MMSDIIQILKERGIFENVTSDELQKLAQKESLTVYAGFDPTSESLQAGNFVTIMVLAHFQRCGHKVIALVGGATGMIGDPSGKSAERNLLTEEQVQINLDGIKENLSRFLEFEGEDAPSKLVNNNDWMKQFTYVDFLRDVGKFFRMGTMLGKDSVKSRLDSENGMSYTEFSYQLLQAYDFLRLYDEDGCSIQVGGSDQWGNITAGIDLVHKQRGKEVFGLTFPLVCDSSGKKFGKSEGNAIYLSSAKTSYFDFYQFFIRTQDEDVERFLKIFTFVSLEEISEIMKESEASPEQRIAHKRLANEVTCLVHGEHGLEIAQKASSVLYGGSIENIDAATLLEIFSSVASCELSVDEVKDANVVDLVAASGLCKSKGEARRLVKNGGLYLNNNRVTDMNITVNDSDIIDGKLILLRSGKRNYFLVEIAK
jgi:tyrosyl-tRNA synthetase